MTQIQNVEIRITSNRDPARIAKRIRKELEESGLIRPRPLSSLEEHARRKRLEPYV